MASLTRKRAKNLKHFGKLEGLFHAPQLVLASRSRPL